MGPLGRWQTNDVRRVQVADDEITGDRHVSILTSDVCGRDETVCVERREVSERGDEWLSGLRDGTVNVCRVKVCHIRDTTHVERRKSTEACHVWLGRCDERADDRCEIRLTGDIQ